METLTYILTTQAATFATILTAVVAYIIYRASKADELQNGVRIIILEIKESERVIRSLLEIKNAGGNYSTDLIRLTPYKGWARYSHLFIKKLTNDEYDQLNEYFKKCESLERYIEKNHNFFWITTEERARQNEQLAAQYAFKNPTIEDDDYKEQIEQSLSLYFENTSSYSPAGIKTQMDRHLSSTNLITTTPLWNKLKELAGYKDLLG
ncbi:hypothetical protein GW943_01920 [Candidatus Parcubacteria bacterium]|uniref:Uncharacterized protein n=1 Tax=Candidatus Kaiserbacteria bacterium CG10_big_fil_rev_8_21_14_0_10_47_16 TaxID=1974608 RepID=A0A2H0UEF4_9BACT|nr:hypothetical protein [Candidatus Parcubacteria bacterium]PIR84789.1 MAG: hypothetical protein COU16_01215 [Candidatus Kaiserbacteria bacterium CG10_big_fil_rev_8_21_14_0_10_47_16]